MTSKAEAHIKELYQKNILKPEDIIVIKAWLNEMEHEGPDYIQHSKRWGDHALYYEWKGYRASCFSGPGRIIYRLLHDIIIVEVHKITPDHDYKKRGS